MNKSKTIIREVESRRNVFRSYWLEDDGYSADRHGHDRPSHWIDLQSGWHNPAKGRGIGNEAVHMIHAGTVKEAMAQMREVERCNCDACIAARGNAMFKLNGLQGLVDFVGPEPYIAYAGMGINAGAINAKSVVARHLIKEGILPADAFAK